jgi:hypothetical protein
MRGVELRETRFLVPVSAPLLSALGGVMTASPASPGAGDGWQFVRVRAWHLDRILRPVADGPGQP